MRLRDSLTLVVILAAIAGLFWFFNLRGDDDTPSNPTNIELYRLVSDDLASVKVTTADGDVLMVREEGSWQVVSEGSSQTADQGRMNGYILALAAVIAESIIDEAPTELAQFGLDPPGATIEVSDGENTRTIFIGGTSPVQSVDYAMVPDRPEVFLISPSWGQIARTIIENPPLPAPTPTPTPPPTETPEPE